jgi:6-phosphogluconolactonase
MGPAIVVATADAFPGVAARVIRDGIDEAIAARGSCALALCGGATPIPVYHALATIPIRWSNVSVYFGDERAVPPDDPGSNFDMARRALLDRVPVPPSQVHRMQAERGDAEGAAADYERLLPPCLGVLLLGMGPDGHVASLFPGSPALAESARRVVAVDAPPMPLQPQLRRLTITPVVFGSARRIVVLVAGTDKAAIVARVLEGPDQPMQLPAQLARAGTWVLDSGAASNLKQRDH